MPVWVFCEGKGMGNFWNGWIKKSPDLPGLCVISSLLGTFVLLFHTLILPISFLKLDNFYHCVRPVSPIP